MERGHPLTCWAKVVHPEVGLAGRLSGSAGLLVQRGDVAGQDSERRGDERYVPADVVAEEDVAESGYGTEPAQDAEEKPVGGAGDDDDYQGG